MNLNVQDICRGILKSLESPSPRLDDSTTDDDDDDDDHDDDDDDDDDHDDDDDDDNGFKLVKAVSECPVGVRVTELGPGILSTCCTCRYPGVATVIGCVCGLCLSIALILKSWNYTITDAVLNILDFSITKARSQSGHGV